MSNSNYMEYKGYMTEIHFDVNDKVLYGKIEGISDKVEFSANNVSKIEEEFQKAVDNYLNNLKKSSPDSEVHQIVITVDDDTYNKIMQKSEKDKLSVLTEIKEAIGNFLSDDKK